MIKKDLIKNKLATEDDVINKPKATANVPSVNTNPNTVANMSAPSPQVSQTPSPVVGANRDIASEIAAEFGKDTIDWSRVGQLANERNEKISSSGMQTQSTSDYINQLYADRNSGTKIAPADQYPGSPNYQPAPVYAEPQPSIMDYIQGLQEAKKMEETPHYHANMEQLTEEELNEPVEKE